eukprot:12913075-Prorocentrum_lima.AAC.1
MVGGVLCGGLGRICTSAICLSCVAACGCGGTGRRERSGRAGGYGAGGWMGPMMSAKKLIGLAIFAQRDVS